MKIGISILSFWAAVWAVWALNTGRAALWAYPGALIVALAPLFLMAPRLSPEGTKEQAKRIGRVVGLATLFETVAIVAGIQWAVSAGRLDLLVCVVAAAVGIHFLPLARWMPVPRYYLTGLALLAAACAGLVLPSGLRDVFVASAASAILWATALSLVFSLPLSAPQAN
jgi:hypothetical protein